ncbi:protein of unknown function DUF224 cysteine-rich region domain protein [Planctopirus limnophila DSM 3776]|uniref:Glycolate oxidase iron-sulfur subunit n=1 Tax=Planctopirus limnophila (strain ATCC 43296 / DSM 3776 / IFAM 1008 / Mu 290) TaxID=521674 RepID=D5SV25_PLAL2|nr:(Fe-S)-binding protein [Planctopirus limnophila]ADG69311.1 protein of unknown function DUF224 cysteine-rich region domain protein [Planctopirus limnophila DSM 3776]
MSTNQAVPASGQSPANSSLPAGLQTQLQASIPQKRFLDCVHCGLCLSACPTYLETGDENDSPRGRIYLMRAVAEGRTGLTNEIASHLEACLDCRACETACPSGVQYGRLIEPFRVAMEATRTDEQPGLASQASQWLTSTLLTKLFPSAGLTQWALWPARWMQALGVDGLAKSWPARAVTPQILQRMHRLLPKLSPPAGALPDRFAPVGPRRATVALLTGCVAEAMFSQTNRATIRVLQHNGCEVLIPKTQACCGAIHYHNGDRTEAMRLARQNLGAFPWRNIDAVIANVAGCGAMLKDYGHIGEEDPQIDPVLLEELTSFAHKIKDVSEFLVDLGPIEPQHPVHLKAVYHDACHLCHAQKVKQQPRQLLSMIPGLTIAPIEEAEICCGAAGSYNLTQPEMADRLGQRKVRHILEVQGVQAVLTGNAGCALQMAACLSEANSSIPVMHVMDILDQSYGPLPDSR